MDNYLFKIDLIKCKVIWTIRFDVLDVLDEIQGKYKARLVLNERPYNEAIAHTQLKIENRKNDPTLFKDDNDAEIKKLKKQLADEQKNLEKAHEVYQPIEFWADVQEVKYILDKTRIEFRVASQLITTLIERRNDLDAYALELNKA